MRGDKMQDLKVESNVFKIIKIIKRCGRAH